MISHVMTGVANFEASFAFYSGLMDALGVELRFCERDRPWAGWHSGTGERPYFVIGRPFDGNPHLPGNGQMVAFLADSREAVHRAYEVAIAHGGACEGAPGLRAEYHANYYGAYFRDLEGNKVCVASHCE